MLAFCFAPPNQMTASPVTDLERSHIITLLEAGKSQHSVARETGRSKGTINAIAAVAGLTGVERNTERSTTKALEAAVARRDYALPERLEVVNELFDKLREMTIAAVKPSDLRDLTIAAGVLIDKRRLEDGEATSRSEVETSERGNRITSRLDELAARRRARDVAVESVAG